MNPESRKNRGPPAHCRSSSPPAPPVLAEAPSHPRMKPRTPRITLFLIAFRTRDATVSSPLGASTASPLSAIAPPNRPFALSHPIPPSAHAPPAFQDVQWNSYAEWQFSSHYSRAEGTIHRPNVFEQLPDALLARAQHALPLQPLLVRSRHRSRHREHPRLRPRQGDYRQ